MDEYESLVSGMPEAIVLWTPHADGPKFLGQTSVVLPPGRRPDAILDFDAWLPDSDAKSLRVVLESLRVEGRGFDMSLRGRDVCVIGRSLLVGKPFALLALSRDASVTICHSKTRDLPGHCRRADVIVAAVGVAQLVRGDWVKPGAVVVDVGINRLPEGRLVGDVAFEEVLAVAGALTPVPGGVGPMTIAMLLSNTALAASRQSGIHLEMQLGPRK